MFNLLKLFFQWLGGIFVSIFKGFVKSTPYKMVEKFFLIISSIICELIWSMLDTIGRSLRNVAVILNAILPYIMWYIGIYLYQQRGKFAVGGEIFIPLFVFLIIYFIKGYANRIGKGEKIPVPKKRFTQPGDDDGEVVVETSRTEEMILYLADLEDWLQRKGLLRK